MAMDRRPALDVTESPTMLYTMVRCYCAQHRNATATGYECCIDTGSRDSTANCVMVAIVEGSKADTPGTMSHIMVAIVSYMYV